MPAPATINDFLAKVQKSGLLESAALDNYLQQNPELPTEPYKLATLMVRNGLLTQFQARQLLRGRYRGFFFGKYKVLDQIGAGGSAAVYSCEHLLMRRPVAIKILPKERASDKVALERFYREARAAAALDHPNIVRAHDIDREAQLHFLVMEYVDGASLQDIVAAHGPLAPERAAHYLSQAAAGLAHAHERGIVHRDIKPGNLLLDRQGTIKILDMGLARFFDRPSEGLTEHMKKGVVLGTADYLAPEQAMNSHDVDIRADLYSLGATGYFLLTGRPPFDGGNIAQKLLAHQMKDPPPIASRRADVPQELIDIIAKMMRKSPAERFQTPAELVAALAKWVATPIAPPSAVEMPKRIAGRSMDSTIAALTAPATGGNPASDSGSRVKFHSTPPPSPAPVVQEDQVGLFDTASPLPATSATPPNEMPASKASTRRRRIDTAAKAPASASKRAAPRRQRKLMWLVGTAVVIFLAGAGALLGWLLPKSAPPRPRTVYALDRPLVVARDGAGLGMFSTLREALASVQPGGRILIRGDLEESGVDDNGKSIFDTNAINVTIAPEQANSIVHWRPPPLHPADQPLLQIANVTGLRLRGIALDGDNRVDDLLVVQGYCPNLRLENIEATGFKRSGMRIRNCSGDDKQPVLIERLHCRSAAGATAIVFDEGAEGSKLACAHIKVNDSRFDGPFQTAVRIENSLMDVKFERNRFYRAGIGFDYRRQNPPYSFGLTLRSNTFAELDAVCHFQTLPPEQTGCVVKIQDNLFYHIQRVMRVDDLLPPLPASIADRLSRTFTAMSGNVRDLASAEGLPSLQCNTMEFTLPANAAKDQEFLRYARESPLAHAGANQGPVGAPPN